MTTSRGRPRRGQLVFVLIMLSLPGIVAASWIALPRLVDQEQLPVGLLALQVASATQSLLLISLAAWVGARLAPSVGLGSPVLSGLIERCEVRPVLTQQIVPVMVGGVVGAGIVVLVTALLAPALQGGPLARPVPMSVRLLYGGITEEVLMRWGLMSMLVWLGWKLLQAGRGRPTSLVMWIAIGLTGLVFGLTHLPVLMALNVPIASAVLTAVVVGNAAFGMVAGFLFWRFGLEAAIVSHCCAHMLAFLVVG